MEIIASRYHQWRPVFDSSYFSQRFDMGLRYFTILFSLIGIIFLFTVLPAWQRNNNDEDRINTLATDAYLKVADLELVVPFVALLEPHFAYRQQSFSLGGTERSKAAVLRRMEMKKLSSQRKTAPAVDRVEILIADYQTTGESLLSQKICPLLKREWARHFCKGEYREISNRLPQRFYIIGKDHIDFRFFTLAIKDEKNSDQHITINLQAPIDGVFCNADKRYCTAGVQLSPHAVAVWNNWTQYKSRKNFQENFEEQGKAIKRFVKYAIGPEPDFEKMKNQ